MVTTKGQTPEKEKRVPDAVADFETLLGEYGIKKAAIIAKNVGDTGVAEVLT